MSFLSMVEANLPPGFRFHPRDDELICDYLVSKVDGAGEGSSSGRSLVFYGHPMMVDVDLNKCEPWELPEAARVANKSEWYFFSQHDRKYATGPRTNRATTSGYWKATGKDRHVSRNGTLVGMRKTLVFYRGRAPRGTKTEWVMHEFRWEGRTRSTRPNPQSPFKEDWVLCRVFCKSRGISGSPGRETSHDGTAGSSHCHSPLMEDDNTYINFEQPPMDSEDFQQVPCFSSNKSHDPTSGLHLQPPMSIRNLTSLLTKNSPLIAQFGTLPELSSHLGHLPPDSKVLSNVIMNQYLTGLEERDDKGKAPDATEGSVSGYSAAAHSDLPTSWSGFIS